MARDSAAHSDIVDLLWAANSFLPANSTHLMAYPTVERVVLGKAIRCARNVVDKDFVFFRV